MKIIIIILLCIVSILAIHQCVTTKNEQTASDNAYKQLQSRFDDTLKDYANYRSLSDSAINNATATAAQYGDIARQSQTQLNQSRLETKSLLSLLSEERKSVFLDTNWIYKHPLYVGGCDSLMKVAAKQDTIIGQYERDNQAHVDALNYETSIRDSALQKERLFSKIFQSQLVSCMNALNDSEKAKKKAQLYAGMAAWGNSITPLGGGEINLGLKTKSDQFYEIKGAYIGQWWVGAGVKFIIHSPF